MTEPQDPQALSIEVLRGNPTDEEVAAVVAVVAEAYRAEVAAELAEDAPRESPWMRSRRNLRQPLRRNMGFGRYAG